MVRKGVVEEDVGIVKGTPPLGEGSFTWRSARRSDAVDGFELANFRRRHTKVAPGGIDFMADSIGRRGASHAAWWLILTSCSVAAAADWPTWRGDEQRRAATSEQLPTELARHWTIPLGPNAPAWPEDPRLQFDAGYEPIVFGERLFVGSAVDDSVAAYDLKSGAELWRTFAQGPVRFAPIWHRGAVYFGSDDGAIYCVDANDGRLRWKHSAAPNGRQVLGSERLISVWPVRGGPVIADGKLFAAVGVWPFEGTFLIALDAATGEPTSVADSGSPEPVLLKERTPQGYLVATKTHLFIPCGRSTVAVFDRAQGDFVTHSYRTSEVSTYHAATSGRWLFHGALAYDLESKTSATPAARQAVLDDGVAYYGDKGQVHALDIAHPELIEGKDRFGKEARRTNLKALWTWNWDATPPAKPAPLKKGEKPVVVPTVRVFLRAGNLLFASRDTTIFALQLAAAAGEAPQLVWKAELPAAPSSMLAANGRLVVVTSDGGIHGFGAAAEAPRTAVEKRAPARTPNPARIQTQVTEALAKVDETAGYAIVYGGSLMNADFLGELAERSQFRVIALAPTDDAPKVAGVRGALRERGLYGSRVAVLAADGDSIQLPPYLANLVLFDREDSSDLVAPVNGRALAKAYRSLRPYGGTLVMQLDDREQTALAEALSHPQFAGAEVRRKGEATRVIRAGALAGSANWTHEYGDPANSLMSRDELVRAPLGVLWFGGPAASGELFYNRHFWGPSMAVIDGRMLVQGPKKLTAIDVYTGRVLWKTELAYDDKNNPGRRGEDFENALMGYHFVAVSDAIYVVQGPDLVKLDPRTGQEQSRWQLPRQDLWGTIRVQGETIVAEAFPATGEFVGKPRRVVAVDRRSGKTLWSREANLSFPVTAVGPDRVYCFDADIENFYLDWKRKGLVPKANEIRLLKAFDLKTGEPVWERSTDKVVTWLGYAVDQDVLVASNKEHIAARRGKDGDELWKKDAEGVGFKGHPESLWDKLILWKGQILDQRGPGLSYDVKSGESIRQKHPVTGESIDWEFTKSGHHCNYAIANPYLMTFRADAAGFCDIETGNTARLDGFRSGCRNSLVPANGVLNAPNFAYGCVCGYSLFTSLAMVHVPENELWGYNALKAGKEPIRRIGINLGGRGDRVAPNGTLWLEHPHVTGTLLGATVKVEGKDVKYFQRHASFLQGEPASLPWVAGCGVEGASSITVRWEPAGKETKQRYRVRLYWAEPESSMKAAQRVFDVRVQGAAAWEKLDVVGAAGGALRAIVRELPEVEASGELTIELNAIQGRTILSGIELEAVK